MLEIEDIKATTGSCVRFILSTEMVRDVKRSFLVYVSLEKDSGETKYPEIIHVLPFMNGVW